MLQISEIYESKQGEGLLTGTLSVFLRTSGCNLRCDFCDTPFTSWAPEGKSWTIDQILAQIDLFPAEHVVITGGEPMLPKEIVPLTHEIKDRGKHITIETAGTLDRNVACDLISISPKLANSTPSIARAGEWHSRHESRRFQPDVLQQLTRRYPYQLKFVVVEPTDLEEIETALSQLGSLDRQRVLLMPEGITPEVLQQRQEWLEPLCAQHGFTFCPRMHIQWYGNRRGT